MEAPFPMIQGDRSAGESQVAHLGDIPVSIAKTPRAREIYAGLPVNIHLISILCYRGNITPSSFTESTWESKCYTNDSHLPFLEIALFSNSVFLAEITCHKLSSYSIVTRHLVAKESENIMSGGWRVKRSYLC